MNNKTAAVDIVIVGGGISGLWLLNRLRKQGFCTILFESKALGGGQTQKSQGIIHGGMKYALQGILTNDAKAVADMPGIFRACLAGVGEIDLRHVPVLSQQQYLWSPSKIAAKFAAFLASAALKGGISSLSKENYPRLFQHSGFKGEVFALNEIVLDVPSLTRELVKENQDAIFHIEPLSADGLKFDQDNHLSSMTVYMAGKAVEVQSQYFIFTAGSGNELITKKLAMPTLNMQRRPLHMVLAKVPFEYTLYGHCLSLGPRPRVTITTHRTQNGDNIWYLGGQIAEDGITRDKTRQIKATSTELRAIFPWLSFKDTEFASFMVDRAEPKQSSGLKPESSFAVSIGNVIVGWPTKLCLAPKLASDILAILKDKAISAQFFDIRELRAWPMPPIAMPVWEEVFCKSVA